MSVVRIALLIFLMIPLAAEEYTLAVIQSYEENHVCGSPQNEGILSALRDAGISEYKGNLKVVSYFMDTKRRNNTPALIAWEAAAALALIEQSNPDIVITVDDNAFMHVGIKLLGTGIPVLFSGVNGQIEDYISRYGIAYTRDVPGKNISGVYEKLHLEDAVRVHSLIFPEFRRIRFFVDTSPTGIAIQKQIEHEQEGFASFCQWDMQIAGSWEEYRKLIEQTNVDPSIDAIYPAVTLLKDAAGNTYTAEEIIPWTAEHAQKPELAINFSYVRFGIFGGAAVDFVAMGYQVGSMAAEVLRGQPVGILAIRDADKYALAFNLKRANALGIEVPVDIIMEADELVLDE